MAHRPYVIVLGNEKGGTGKSTLAMHVIVALLHAGQRVGSMDLDARQGSLTRYIEHRKRYAESTGADIACPQHEALFRSDEADLDKAKEIERTSFEKAWESMQSCDVVVMDTPGAHTYLSELAHTYADTLITPMNDSLVDLDVLVHMEEDDPKKIRPSAYAETVWEQKKRRALERRDAMDWIVLRNRLGNLSSKNKEEMQDRLTEVARRLGIRLVAGFSERVIFRSLFMKGLTLLDVKSDQGVKFSHVGARQELRELIEALRLPGPAITI